MDQSIYLPLARKLLERDLATIQNGELFKIKEPYIRVIQQTIEKINNELKNVKTNMYKIGLKVVEGEQEGLFKKYDWFCRGYNGTRTFNSHNIKMQVRDILLYYMTEGEK